MSMSATAKAMRLFSLKQATRRCASRTSRGVRSHSSSMRCSAFLLTKLGPLPAAMASRRSMSSMEDTATILATRLTSTFERKAISSGSRISLSAARRASPRSFPMETAFRALTASSSSFEVQSFRTLISLFATFIVVLLFVRWEWGSDSRGDVRPSWGL